MGVLHRMDGSERGFSMGKLAGWFHFWVQNPFRLNFSVWYKEGSTSFVKILAIKLTSASQFCHQSHIPVLMPVHTVFIITVFVVSFETGKYKTCQFALRLFWLFRVHLDLPMGNLYVNLAIPAQKPARSLDREHAGLAG